MKQHQGAFARVVTLDFETRSELDLKKVGAFVYANHPSTQVMCCVFAVDDHPPILWHEECFETLQEMLAPLLTPDTLWSFHNAEFEMSILQYNLGIIIPLEQMIDSAAVARHANLPGKLEELADFFGMAKDMSGHAVMMKLSRPRKASKANPDKFWTPASKPEDFAALYAYCRQDVEVQRMCLERLPPMSDFELRVFRATFRANARGMPVDVASAEKLQGIAKHAKAALSKKIEDKYGFTLGQVAEIAAYLHLPDVTKATLRDFLKDPSLPPDQYEVAKDRQTFAKSSTAKIDALLNFAQVDGRIHGGLVYGGAERTLRFSGRAFQAQNLVRGLGKLQGQAYVALQADMLEWMYDDVLATIAGMIRGLITDGVSIYWGDFSQIEARLLGWYAGDDALLEIFRTGGDPYKVAASKIYHVPLAEVTPDQRFMGKQSVLACLSNETNVLTKRGWVRILDVTTDDQLWDGEEWITHLGVIPMGVKPTISRHGLIATANHLVWDGTRWVSWFEVQGKNTVFQSALASVILPSSDMSARGSNGSLSVAVGCVEESEHTTPTISKMVAAPAVKSAEANQRMIRVKRTWGSLTSFLISNIDIVCSVAYPTSTPAAPTQKDKASLTMADAGSLLGSQIGARSLRISSLSPGGISLISKLIASTMTRVMRRVTSSFQLNQITPEIKEKPTLYPRASSNLRPVYDIAHAGPRNRFTVLTDAGPIIVHNCGYGLGKYGFASLLDTTYDVQVSDSEAEAVVAGFRENNPKIVAFWDRIGAVLDLAYLNIGKRYKITPRSSDIDLTIKFTDAHTFDIRLPSGRKLNFYKVTHDKDGWECFSRLKDGGGYGQRRIYPGLLCGVIVQSTARELIARSIVRLDEENFPVILTVHDENVSIGDGRFDLFKSIMLEQPDWLTNFPLGADIMQDTRYRK